MTPQERVEWLARSRDELTSNPFSKNLDLVELKAIREQVNTAIYDLENKRKV